MDITAIIRAVFSLTFVIGLLLIISWVMKKFGLEKRLKNRINGSLELKESLYIDAQHRIVIIKRKKKNFVVMIGQNMDILLETYSETEDD